MVKVPFALWPWQLEYTFSTGLSLNGSYPTQYDRYGEYDCENILRDFKNACKKMFDF